MKPYLKGSLVLSIACLSACGSSYEVCDTPDTGQLEPLRDGGPPSALDSAVPVTGDDAAFVDDAGAPPVFVDASIPNDEPDVPVDARPSDDPSASGWIDPPVIGADDDCCSAATAQDLATEDADLGDGGPVSLAWDGQDWILAWTSAGGTAVRRLDRGAQPITARRSLGTLATPMAWGHHELAAWTVVSDRQDALSFFDRDGNEIGFTPATREDLRPAGVTRHAAIHGWATMSAFRPAGTDTVRHSLVTRADGADTVEVDLGRADMYSGGLLAGVVSVASRLVTFENDAFVTTVRVFANAALVPSTPLHLAAGGYALGARLRDTVVVAVQPNTGEAQSFVVDPFTSTALSPTTLPDGLGWFQMAGDDIGGTLGICYTDGSMIRFALLGPEGAPLGRSIALSPSYGGYPTCAVGSAAQDEYLVAWYGGSVALGNIHASAVHVHR